MFPTFIKKTFDSIQSAKEEPEPTIDEIVEKNRKKFGLYHGKGLRKKHKNKNKKKR